MNTGMTGGVGPENIRELDQAVRAHHGDTQAWTRLGQLLKARRSLLDHRYSNRRVFTDERCIPLGLNYKFVYDLEGGPRWGRRGFPAGKLIAVAEAYRVTPGSIGAALAGGHLEPAPDRTPAPPAAPVLALAPGPVPVPEPDPPPGVLMSGVLAPAALAAAAPYATEILTRLRNLAVAGIMRPSGHQLFPDSDYEARIWDLNADELPDEEAAWLVAALRARRGNHQQDRTVVLTAV